MALGVVTYWSSFMSLGSTYSVLSIMPSDSESSSSLSSVGKFSILWDSGWTVAWVLNKDGPGRVSMAWDISSPICLYVRSSSVDDILIFSCHRHLALVLQRWVGKRVCLLHHSWSRLTPRVWPAPQKLLIEMEPSSSLSMLKWMFP